ncbi:MAG: hypothetical protein L6437_04150 [Kiritimatiellae bacterium]|nr:hypothetical protein [Kiritimatiellia bacterium]
MAGFKKYAAHVCSSVQDGFKIALWCAPPAEETTLRRYREIAACGFNTVIVWWNDLTLNRKTMDLCQDLGMKAWISDFRLWTAPSAPAGWFEQNINELISDNAGHPGLGGYYLYHAPNAALFPRLATLNQYLLQKDPGRVPFINLPPVYAGKKALGLAGYDRYLTEYIRKVKPALLCWGHFPFLRNRVRPDYFTNLELVRRHSLTAGLPFMPTILATTHVPYRDPSEAELRWQVYTSLCYGAKGIGYFTYWTPGPSSRRFRHGLIDPEGQRTDKYNQVQRINRRLQVMAPVLSRLCSLGVYHTAPLPCGTRAVGKDAPIKAIRKGALVVGWFQEPWSYPRREYYLFVVNRSWRRSAEAIIELKCPLRAVREIAPPSDSSGREARPCRIAGEQLFMPLEAGEGRLVKTVYR